MSSGQRRDFASKQSQLRAHTAERLEAIVEAAERAAESVIDDAEAQARRHLAQAKAEADRVAEGRLSELAAVVDSLVAQAGSLRQDAERLQATLEEAQARLAGEEPAPVMEQPREAGAQVEPQPPRLWAVGGDDQAPGSSVGDRDKAAGARLLATQLAVSGSSREEIEARLRTGFEVEDTSAILDAILGPDD
ncbi:MAG: hypothetical protein ACJ76D_12965 [Solirubrobacterales bacterium]